jgi:hypothetical protein
MEMKRIGGDELFAEILIVGSAVGVAILVDEIVVVTELIVSEGTLLAVQVLLTETKLEVDVDSNLGDSVRLVTGSTTVVGKAIGRVTVAPAFPRLTGSTTIFSIKGSDLMEFGKVPTSLFPRKYKVFKFLKFPKLSGMGPVSSFASR